MWGSLSDPGTVGKENQRTASVVSPAPARLFLPLRNSSLLSSSIFSSLLLWLSYKLTSTQELSPDPDILTTHMAVVQTQPNLPPSPISDDTSIGTKTPPAQSNNAASSETPKGKETRTISVVVVADMVCTPTTQLRHENSLIGMCIPGLSLVLHRTQGDRKSHPRSLSQPPPQHSP